MAKVGFLTEKYVEDILLNDLTKNGTIVLRHMHNTRIITAIKNGKIEYTSDKLSSVRYYDIKMFVDTVNDFYGHRVTRDMLSRYNACYSESGKPCNVMMFFLLLVYLFGVVIYGKGVKNDPYYVFVMFYYPPFSSAYIPSQAVCLQVSDFYNNVCLGRVFVKNIMLRAGNVYLSVLNVDDVLKAVKSAYLSMQPRTYGKSDPNVKPEMDKISKDRLLKCLAKRLVDFFKNNSIKNQVDFDKWHNDLCNWFLNALNNVLHKSGYCNVAYGKAQKIVNVAFKNLYLFDDATLYEERFKLCHFIIDSANLKWYNSFARPKYAKVWSDMTDTEYRNIQKDIRNYLNSNRNYPTIPFYAEFYVWSDYYKW